MTKTYQFNVTVVQGDDGSIKFSGNAPAPIVASPPVVTPPVVTPPVVVPPPVVTPPVVTPPTSTTGIIPYTGFARTGHATAPLTGSGLLEPAEPPASPNPVGKTYDIPALVMPTVAGQTYVDPVFGTTIRRLPTNMRHVYSQMCPFSTDDSLMITTIPDGLPNAGYHVIKYPSMQEMALPGFASSVSPRWLPGTHKVVCTDWGWANPLGGSQLANVTIHVYDCDTGTVAVAGTFPFVQVNSGHAFESLSWDGQWSSLYAMDSANVWWQCAVNLVTGKVGAKLHVSGFAAPDWVAVDALGQYLLCGSNGTSNGASTTGFGIEIYDINTGAFIRRMEDRDPHLDHGIDADGKSIFLDTTPASQFNSNNPAIVVRDDATGVTTQVRQMTWRASPNHLSLQSAPGLLVTDSGWGPFDSNGNRTAPTMTGLTPFEGEVVCYYKDGSARRLCHHRSNQALIADTNLSYWSQAQAAGSRSGKLIAFATNWNTAGQNPQGFCIEGLIL